MTNISITIDVNKIPKGTTVERRYFDKQNKEVICRDLKLNLVALKEPKLIKEGQDWEMHKTHFVALEQTKEQKASKEKSVIIGDGITFIKKQDKHDDINPEDIKWS